MSDNNDARDQILNRMLGLFKDHKFITHTKDQIYMSAVYDDGMAKSDMHVVATLLPYGRVFLGGDIVNAAFGFSSRQSSINDAVSYFSSMTVIDLYRKIQTSIPRAARDQLLRYDHKVMAEDIQWYIDNEEYTTDDQRNRLYKLLEQVESDSEIYGISELYDILGGERDEPDGYRAPDFMFMASAVFREMHRRIIDGQ